MKIKTKDLDNLIWKLEGKKVKTTIAQVREIRRIIDKLIRNHQNIANRYKKIASFWK